MGDRRSELGDRRSKRANAADQPRSRVTDNCQLSTEKIMNAQMTPILPARLNARGGYTLVEILVATTLTLILMFAVVQIFAMISGSVSDSRALLEMNDRLRSAKTRLQMDLEGLTVVPLPPRGEEDDGYLEIIEGAVMEPIVYGPIADRYQTAANGRANRWYGRRYHRGRLRRHTHVHHAERANAVRRRLDGVGRGRGNVVCPRQPALPPGETGRTRFRRQQARSGRTDPSDETRLANQWFGVLRRATLPAISGRTTPPRASRAAALHRATMTSS